MVALNKLTGEVVWTSKGLADEPSYAAPVIYNAGGIRQYTFIAAHSFYGIRADTGAILWSFKPFPYHNPCNTPLCMDGGIFYACGMGSVGVAVTIGVKGEAVTAAKAWDTKDADTYLGGCVLVNGMIYIGNRKGWACLDAKTGQTKWKAQAKDPPTVGEGSITYADGMLYTLGQDGVMGLAEASPDAYKPVSSGRGVSVSEDCSMSAAQLNAQKVKDILTVDATGLEVPNPGRDTWAHPVISNGKLYLRQASKLFVYAIK